VGLAQQTMEGMQACSVLKLTMSKLGEEWQPRCDRNGWFEAMQCHRGNKDCWCVTAAGKKLPGVVAKDADTCAQARQSCHELAHRQRDVDEATCAERQATTLEEARLECGGDCSDAESAGIVIPQCSDDGTYLARQAAPTFSSAWCTDMLGNMIYGTSRGLDGPELTVQECADLRAVCGLDKLPATKETPCQRQRKAGLSHMMPGVFIPACDEEGNYAALQCHGSTGFCWCAKPDGTKIETTATRRSLGVDQCLKVLASPAEGESPCKWAMRRAESSWTLGAYVPQCNLDGSYAPRQCHASTGQCWCVNEAGDEISGTRNNPGEPMFICETTATTSLIQTAPNSKCSRLAEEVAGKRLLGSFKPQCKTDGSFEAMQCHGSIRQCWCVDEEGEEFGGTRQLFGELKTEVCESLRSQCVESPCDLAVAKGMCRAYFPRFFFNRTSAQCESFVYGGCGGNANSFETMEECSSTCSSSDVTMHDTEGDRTCTRALKVAESMVEMGMMGVFMPKCEGDGDDWHHTQCHGAGGCWCVNKLGQALAGTFRRANDEPPSCEKIAPRCSRCSDPQHVKCTKQMQQAGLNCAEHECVLA